MVLARCGSNSSKRLYDVDSQETLLLATREAPLLLVTNHHITSRQDCPPHPSTYGHPPEK